MWCLLESTTLAYFAFKHPEKLASMGQKAETKKRLFAEALASVASKRCQDCSRSCGQRTTSSPDDVGLTEKRCHLRGRSSNSREPGSAYALSRSLATMLSPCLFGVRG